MGNKPDGYYGPEESTRPDPEKDAFPERTDAQVELREDARTKHQENVDAIKRRGHHDRLISKLQYWKELELKGYDMRPRELAEVESLGVNLADVRETMTAAGQPPGDYALLLALGVSS